MENINTYFKAWKTQDTKLCRDIFCVNAKYIVKPHVEEYYGIENIIKYWTANPVSQHNPNPIIIECFPNSNNTKWFCEFRNEQELYDNELYTQKNKITEGMILFTMDLSNNKIIELREFYRSRVVDGINRLMDKRGPVI